MMAINVRIVAGYFIVLLHSLWTETLRMVTASHDFGLRHCSRQIEVRQPQHIFQNYRYRLESANSP